MRMTINFPRHELRRAGTGRGKETTTTMRNMIKCNCLSGLQYMILGMALLMFGMQIKLEVLVPNYINDGVSGATPNGTGGGSVATTPLQLKPPHPELPTIKSYLQSSKTQEDGRKSRNQTVNSSNMTTPVGKSMMKRIQHNNEPHVNITSLPSWMMEYFEWHQQQRLTILQPDVWQDSQRRPKLLILQCTEQNVKCGGLSDRLKPLPLILLGAAKSKRILLIRWKNRPTKLEHFLLPPVGPTSLDWTVPIWLDEYLDATPNLKTKHVHNVKPFMKQVTSSPNVPVITTTIQWWDGGEQAYKDYLELGKDDDQFRRIYHDLFFGVLFTPTKPILDILATVYETTPLHGRNEYTVAHYRSLWWEQQDPPAQQVIDDVAMNSIKCANQISPNKPIYFATDNKDAQKAIINYISTKNNDDHPQIVVIPHKQLLHLDRTPSNTTIEEIYPIFVDLLLLANGNCVSFGDGGFGRYGLMLSRNYNCYHRHIFRHKIQSCNWAK